jgi:signal transduction histidine kinase
MVSIRPVRASILKPRGLFSREGRIGPYQRMRLDAIDTARELLPASLTEIQSKLKIFRHSVVNYGHDIQFIKQKHNDAVLNGKVASTEAEVRTLLNNFNSLITIAKQLALEPEIDSVFEAVLEGVKELGFSRGFLYRYDTASGLLQIKSSINPEDIKDSRYLEPTDPRSISDTPKMTAIEKKEIVVVPNRIDNRPPEIIIPLVIQGEVVGLLKVDNNERKPLFDPAVNPETIKTILMTFANLAGAAKRTASTFREREELIDKQKEMIQKLENAKDRIEELLNLARIHTMARNVGHVLGNNMVIVTGLFEMIERKLERASLNIEADLKNLKIDEPTRLLLKTFVFDVLEIFSSKKSLMYDAAGKLEKVSARLEPFLEPISMDIVTYDVHSLINQAVEAVHIFAVENDIEFNLPDLGNPLLAKVTNSMWEPIYHLIENSIDAIKIKRKQAGEDFAGKVVVRTYKLEKEKKIRIEIEDNGNGIPKDIIEQISDPFFFSDDKDFTKNTGLGLSFAKLIIEKTGGSLGIMSKPGSSTNVIIEFPSAD